MARRITKRRITLAQWKPVAERYRQYVRSLEKKVRVLEDLLLNRPMTPEKLKQLGVYVHSVLPKEETLQQRMCRYCDLAGYEYRNKGKTIEYDTPSGIIVTIYFCPVRCFGRYQHWDYYGHFDRHEDIGGIKYIDEPKAKYLYDLLGKKIEELKTEKQDD